MKSFIVFACLVAVFWKAEAQKKINEKPINFVQIQPNLPQPITEGRAIITQVPLGQRIGLPIPGSLFRKNADGNILRNCYDWRTGIHAHAKTWVSLQAWKLYCNNGTIEIEACIGSARSGFAEIPVNRTIEVDGFWFKCDESDSVVKYTEEAGCIVNGRILKVNTTFPKGAFVARCDEDGYSLVGCYYRDGAAYREMDVNTWIVVGVFNHSCYESERVPGQIRYKAEAIYCEQNSKRYDQGENWVVRNLQYECKARGEIDITNCVTAEGIKIPIGQGFTQNNKVYRCYRLHNVVYYHTYSCGLHVSCQPAPAPVDDLPPSHLSPMRPSFPVVPASVTRSRNGAPGLPIAVAASSSVLPIAAIQSPQNNPRVLSPLSQNTERSISKNQLNAMNRWF